MVDTDFDLKNRTAMAAAYFQSLRYSQDEIKEILQTSQAEVSRLLRIAKHQDWLVWKLQLPPGFDPTEFQESAFKDRKKLKQRLDVQADKNGGVPLKDVRVIYSGKLETAEEQRRARFGRSAADYVVKLLRVRTTKTCAVAWGRTVKSLIEGIPVQAKKRPDLTFVPISGDPLANLPAGFSPSEAAQALGEKFGGMSYSLKGVAARIPWKLRKDAETIRAFFEWSPGYKDILAHPHSLKAEVDMIITGLGDISTSKDDPWFTETQALEEIELKDITAGNVAGVWLPSDPKDRRQVIKINEINERWLGMQEENLRACAERGNKSGTEARPGVVVLAREPQKAAIFKQALGMINHLIIDRDLAEAMLVEL